MTDSPMPDPFDPRDSFQLGVCYYPEQWPEAQWHEDAARMARTGLTWVACRDDGRASSAAEKLPMGRW